MKMFISLLLISFFFSAYFFYQIQLSFSWLKAIKTKATKESSLRLIKNLLVSKLPMHALNPKLWEKSGQNKVKWDKGI